MADVDRLLLAWREGDETARDEVIRVLYADLRRMARHHLRNEHARTLQPTELVHEVCLRILGRPPAENTARFFGQAATVMRCVLVDRARRRTAAKRGGGLPLAEFTAEAAVAGQGPDHLLRLDEALSALETEDARRARVVELRFFGGLSVEQAASVLEVSPATVKRDWTEARAWLHQRLSADGEGA